MYFAKCMWYECTILRMAAAGKYTCLSECLTGMVLEILHENLSIGYNNG
jgi:hypothetical protein